MLLNVCDFWLVTRGLWCSSGQEGGLRGGRLGSGSVIHIMQSLQAALGACGLVELFLVLMCFV